MHSTVYQPDLALRQKADEGYLRHVVSSLFAGKYLHPRGIISEAGRLDFASTAAVSELNNPPKKVFVLSNTGTSIRFHGYGVRQSGIPKDHFTSQVKNGLESPKIILSLKLKTVWKFPRIILPLKLKTAWNS